jgi:NAD(P)-dependent dehydrogenase (short-subunit alcohol dehydrogenase family)
MKSQWRCVHGADGTTPVPSPKTAVITGAAGGIGSAIARALAADAFGLYLVGRTVRRLERVALSLRQISTAPVTICPLDMASEAGLEAFAERLAASGAQIDAVVFSHGNYARARLEEASVEDLDRLYAANVRGPFLLTRLLMPLLRASMGQVVFMNSTVGLKGSENVGQYSAMQHALKGLADTLRNEVNPSGVRVLSVFCGRTATPLQERIFAMEGRKYVPEFLSQPEDIAHVVSMALKLGPNSEITDIRLRPMRPVPPPAPHSDIVSEEDSLADLTAS